MTKNHAVNYAEMIGDAIGQGSIFEQAVNRNCEWCGADEVRIYAHGRAVAKRAVTQSRDFIFTVGRGQRGETEMAAEAGQALRRTLDEKIIPTIDVYRLHTMYRRAGSTECENDKKLDTRDALVAANESLTKRGAPLSGRVAIMNSRLYEPGNVITYQEDMVKRFLIDNLRIIHAPKRYMPTDCDFVMVHPEAVTVAEKLAQYTIHDYPMGGNGWTVEGRILYDAFVNNDCNWIYVHRTPAKSAGRERMGNIREIFISERVGYFKIQAATEAVAYKIRKSATRHDPELDRLVIDPEKNMLGLIMACMVEPKVKNADALQDMLLPGEYAKLSSAVAEICGFG